MKTAWFVVGMAVWLSAGFSVQAAAPLDESAVEAARARLDAQREIQNAEFAAQDDACLARFAVTDCQNAVAKRRRAASARLKREEVELNNAVRQQRAQEQVTRTQEKQDARATRDASNAVAAPPDRERALQEKIQNHPQPAPAQARRAKVVEAADAKVLEEKRKAYADKQQTLLKKRQERDQRLQEQGPPKNHLPVPP